MSINVTVPDIGDFEKVEIIEVLVKSGDNIKKDDPIVTLESDKSSVEIPSTHEGRVEKVNVKIGDKVSKGDLLITLINSEKTNDKKEKKAQSFFQSSPDLNKVQQYKGNPIARAWL